MADHPEAKREREIENECAVRRAVVNSYEDDPDDDLSTWCDPNWVKRQEAAEEVTMRWRWDVYVAWTLIAIGVFGLGKMGGLW